VPKRERKLIAACTWVGNKFSYRVPDDMVLLRCFMGGDALKESDDSLWRQRGASCKPLWGFKPCRYSTAIARWPNSMAQYTVGHEQRMLQIDAMVKEVPGLHLQATAIAGSGCRIA